MRFILNANIPYGDRLLERYRVEHPSRFYDFSKERNINHRKIGNINKKTGRKQIETPTETPSYDHVNLINAITSTSTSAVYTMPPETWSPTPKKRHDQMNVPVIQTNIDNVYWSCTEWATVSWPRFVLEFYKNWTVWLNKRNVSHLLRKNDYNICNIFKIPMKHNTL